MNIERNFEKTVFVPMDRTQESIDVDPRIPYNVTVTVYDRCQECYMSEVFHVFEHIENQPDHVSHSVFNPPSMQAL